MERPGNRKYKMLLLLIRFSFGTYLISILKKRSSYCIMLLSTDDEYK